MCKLPSVVACLLKQAYPSRQPCDRTPVEHFFQQDCSKNFSRNCGNARSLLKSCRTLKSWRCTCSRNEGCAAVSVCTASRWLCLTGEHFCLQARAVAIALVCAGVTCGINKPLVLWCIYCCTVQVQAANFFVSSVCVSDTDDVA